MVGSTAARHRTATDAMRTRTTAGITCRNAADAPQKENDVQGDATRTKGRVPFWLTRTFSYGRCPIYRAAAAPGC